MKSRHILFASALAVATVGCTSKTTEDASATTETATTQTGDSLQQKLDMYTNVLAPSRPVQTFTRPI